MRIDEIERKQSHPIASMRWDKVSKAVLDTSIETAKYDQAAIRRARGSGLDRYDETQTGYKFTVIWVLDNCVRMDGEDWHLWPGSATGFLTGPEPVAEGYREQFRDGRVGTAY